MSDRTITNTKAAPTPSGLNPHFSIPAQLASLAKTQPESPAILAPGRQPLNYGHLWRQIGATVDCLNHMGLGRGDRVALVLPNGPEMLVAFLAISSGSTSAPLNPNYQEREFEFYIKSLMPKALVVQVGFGTKATTVAQRLGIRVVELCPTPDAGAGTFLLHGTQCSAQSPGFAETDDTGLLLHTSGTTARPKIVPLTHRNLCVSAHNVGASLRLSRADRSLNVMPLFHIHGLVGGALSSLLTGGSVVSLSGFEAAEFFNALRRERPTWYTAVPTVHHTVLTHSKSEPQTLDGHSLRFIRSCSAALPRKIMSGLEEIFQVPVIEAYGMTEAAHQISSNPLPPLERKPGSVGVSSRTEIAIMNEQGMLLGANDRGEIVVRGENVMSGYEERSGSDEGSFSGGWLRTGDEGYLDDDGYLFITGRLKEMINRGGEKISPLEIDEALLQHPAVEQAVAFAVPHQTLGEDVAAAVVLRKETFVSDAEIHKFAGQRLARFKVPCRIIIVDEIPKGPTGKIQRVNLAQALGSGLETAFEAPRSDLEKLLAAIWEEVLQVKGVGIRDNFFTLGGDSLQAMRLFMRIEKECGIKLPWTILFETRTIEQLAAWLNRETPNEVLWSALVPLQPNGSRPPFFCVHPAGGGAFYYHDLALFIGQDQPFYGIQAEDFDQETTSAKSIEDLARRYIGEIKNLQHRGPYFIGGLCFGGLVAYEIARQIQQQGEKVAFLALLDTYAPGYEKFSPKSARLKFKFHRIRQRVGLELKNLQLLGSKERIAYLFMRIKRVTRRMGRRMSNYTRDFYDSMRDPLHRELRQVRQLHQRAAEMYVPRPYSGNVLLFRASEQPAGWNYDTQLGWGGLIDGQIRVYEVSGYHESLATGPSAQFLAQTLRLALLEAQHEHGFEETALANHATHNSLAASHRR